MENSKFKVGDRAYKPKGYKFPCTVVSIFKTTSGEVRIVGEMIDNGMLHIFNESQLELETHEIELSGSPMTIEDLEWFSQRRERAVDKFNDAIKEGASEEIIKRRFESLMTFARQLRMAEDLMIVQKLSSKKQLQETMKSIMNERGEIFIPTKQTDNE